MILTKDHAGSGKTCSILQGLQPAAVLKYSGLFLTLVGPCPVCVAHSLGYELR